MFPLSGSRLVSTVINSREKGVSSVSNDYNSYQWLVEVYQVLILLMLTSIIVSLSIKITTTYTGYLAHF